MICASIGNKTLDGILDILQDPYVEMAEIRLDLCNLSADEIRDLFSGSEKALIASFRVSSHEQWPIAQELLSLAAESGARYVDLDIEAPAAVSKFFQKHCRQNGVDLIRSFHDPIGTPPVEILLQTAARALRYGAGIVKICTTSSCDEDTALVLSLYSEGSPVPPERLVAFAMGDSPCASASRLEALRLGAPFVYACISDDQKTAAGQQTCEQLHRAVYGDHYGFFRDSIEAPASKSYVQRAILCAAIAEGTSHLRGYTPCDDSESAIALARSLGAKVTRREGTLTITGIGPVVEPLRMQSVNCGESGLLARLMIPLLSEINGAPFEVRGEGSLLTRPLSCASDIMAAFGVILSSEGGKETFVPVRVRGVLYPGTADIEGRGGSQLISGLLMSLPLCDKPSDIYVGEPKSIPYMFMTLDVMRKFGVEVKAELEGNAQMLELQDWSFCTGIHFLVRSSQRYKAAEVDLEGDWSASANFLVAGAIFGSAEVVGVDNHSLQADISILDILVEAGAQVAYEEEEPVVSVRKAPLTAFTTDLNNAPDLFPIVSVLAAFCPGISEIAGVGRLRTKESDRGRAILEMLTSFGVKCQIFGDNLQIEGESYSSRLLGGRLLRGGNFTACGDHRMAMALAVAALGADSPVVVDNPCCVSKSFPAFWETIR